MERTEADGCELLAVQGELDVATAPRMIAALNDAFANMRLPLVVDLSKVDFMDSTGLALLINAHRRVLKRGRGFAIVCPGGPLVRVFEIADMVQKLHVCPDRVSAVEVATAPAGG